MAALVLSSLPPAWGAGSTAHGAISIQGNSDFTPANGVVAGSGSPADPYIIDGWVIATTGATAIEIQSTTAAFVISNVTLDGNSTANPGLRLSNVKNGIVRDSLVRGYYHGISLANVAQLRLENLTVEDNKESGIYLQDNPDNVTITGSTLRAATGYGVLGGNLAGPVTISNNSISSQGSASFFVGGDITNENPSARLIVENNTVRGAALRVRMSNAVVRNNDIQSADQAGIITDGGRNIEFSGNVLNGSGILVYSKDETAYGTYSISPDNLINGLPFRYYADCHDVAVDGSEDTANGGQVGAFLFANCTNVSVTGWTIGRSGYGIQFQRVAGAHVAYNRVEGATAGLYVGQYSSGLRAVGNEFLGGTFGALTQDSTDLLFFRNRAADNSRYGIYTWWSSDLNITENAIENNPEGGLSILTATNATIYHNNFVNNTPQAWANFTGIGFDNGYPDGGNYWSDYAGVDLCSGPDQDQCAGGDGIGDVARTVDGQTGPAFPSGPVDRYPLMEPFNLPVGGLVVALSATPSWGNRSTAFVFDASKSFDYGHPDDPLAYSFDFNGDGSFDLNSSSPVVNFTFAADGDYQVVVRATTLAGHFREATVAVSVGPNPPGEPPRIFSEQIPTHSQQGARIDLSVRVTRADLVEKVRVSFEPVGGGLLQTLEMALDSNGSYAAALPPQSKAGELRYFVEIEYAGGRIVRVPESGFRTITITPPPGAFPMEALWLVGLGGVAVAAVVVTGSQRGRYTVVWFLVSKLFPRMKKETLLGHFVRGRLYQVIAQNPGVHFSELRRLADVSNGTASHHLHVLQLGGFVRAQPEGMLVRFFPTGQPFEEESYGLLDEDKAVLAEIEQAPGTTEADIASRLSLHPSSVQRIVERLVRLGYLARNAGKDDALVARPR